MYLTIWEGVDCKFNIFIKRIQTNSNYIMLFTPPDAAADTNIVSKELHLHNAVINNVKILDKNDKWGQLQFVEAYYIKKLAPEVNFGLKALKELQLFD